MTHVNGSRPLTIGLLGCGTVGGGVATRILHPEGLALEGRTIALHRALVRDLHKLRTPAAVYPHLTTDPADVLGDPAVDVVVECLGGVEPAGEYVESALRRGRHVVTANKALLAERGAHLEALALEYGVTIRYEAAVAGATPIVRTLRHLAAIDDVREVGGVLNGTTNFILETMDDGKPLPEAIALAQAAGFAEQNPAMDLEGIDAAQKLTILAAIAFGWWPRWTSIARRGIDDISGADVAFARARGCKLKLTGWARRNGKAVIAAVGPTFVPRDHPFAGPRGVENVILIVTRHAGPTIIGGLGAGRDASASAIIGDLADIVRGEPRSPSHTNEKESTHA